MRVRFHNRPQSLADGQQIQIIQLMLPLMPIMDFFHLRSPFPEFGVFYFHFFADASSFPDISCKIHNFCSYLLRISECKSFMLKVRKENGFCQVSPDSREIRSISPFTPSSPVMLSFRIIYPDALLANR